MLKSFSHIHLLIGWLPITVFTIAGLGITALIVTQCWKRQWKTVGRELIITLVAAACGLLATWLVSDVFMLFEVSLGWMVIFAVTAGFAALGFVISSIVFTHGWKRILASAMIIVVLIATALRIDMIYGEYTTVGSLFAVPTYQRFDGRKVSRPVMSVQAWRKLAEDNTLHTYPEKGQSFSVDIDNRNSQFEARTADIYLPPAALSEKPPALPVFVLLAGQPGSPDRLFTAGGIESMMNTYAAKHNGLAPIVVSPDQNGASNRNSLCVDSPIHGKAETYLTQDVPNWISHNLPVSTNPDMWAIGGFSQGGTCSTQLGARHPNIYGNMMPADGEIGPTQGSKESMIANYFGGNAQAFQDQEPVTAIAQHAPSNQTIFAGAGASDPTSVKNMTTIAQAGKRAGMEVVVVEAKGTGHDWHAVRASWEPALNWLGERMGLGDMSKPLSEYKNISEVKIER
ncbi:esterase [Bombiscardovia apis]|uniref:Esterase n=1 Tax=Bombiscardovia apis TaxID=2932182 RepID=A0ABN6SJA6_9BIFI|nr:alpha/beta hydrolase-fold protein [Bombiscardovia apis]BDR55011.1 esterase [Bombiscardovia apis]